MDRLPEDHPTDATLGSYGLGTLADDVTAAVDQHLEGCADCRRRVTMIAGDGALGRIGAAAARLDETIPSDTIDGDRSTSSPAPGFHSGALPPELVDHPQYRVVRELGRGGMGVVYLAQNRLMDRLEVLKVLSKSIADRGEVVERFLREIRAAARLGHPNVVTAYSALRIGDLLVFAMEYVEGEDLAALVRTRGPLPVAQACFFAYQAASGLEHAHERGMVHRDIKPGNLILTKQGKRPTVKILDFGLAKVTSEEPVDGSLTRDGQILGTPDYLAPEQTRNAQKADIRADIYSLGCTLYYLLAGAPPFRGGSLLDILHSHRSEEAQTLDRVRSEVPPELAAIVVKMMAKEPEHRYETPAQVAAALVPFFKPGEAVVPGEPRRPGGPARTPSDTLPSRTEPQWDTLITLDGANPTLSQNAAEPTRRRSGLLGMALAAAALIVGFIVAATIGMPGFKDKDGVVVLENLPNDADVFMDGNKHAVTRPAGGNTAELTAASGKHGIQVKAKGFQVFEDQVSLGPGQRSGLRVQLAPVVVARKKPSVAKAAGRAGAREFQGKSYQVFPEQLSWNGAREKCRALGGHLARVTSAEENDFLSKLLTAKGLESAWLGATDEKTEGEWLWVDGSPLSYTNWDQGQPNNGGEGEHYLLLWLAHDAKWTDQPDESDRHQPGFICQWD